MSPTFKQTLDMGKWESYFEGLRQEQGGHRDRQQQQLWRGVLADQCFASVSSLEVKTFLLDLH